MICVCDLLGDINQNQCKALLSFRNPLKCMCNTEMDFLSNLALLIFLLYNIRQNVIQASLCGLRDRISVCFKGCI